MSGGIATADELAETVARYESLDVLGRDQFDLYAEAESALERHLLAEATRLCANCEYDRADELLAEVAEADLADDDVPRSIVADLSRGLTAALVDLEVAAAALQQSIGA